MNFKPSLEVLYKRHASGLLALCMRYVGDRSSAEDVLHDVFVRAGVRLESFSFRSDASTAAWLKKIAVSRSIEWVKQRRRGPVYTDALLDIKDDAIIDTDQAGSIPYDKLMEFIAELPDGYRTVFNLYCMEGYSHARIAEMLGITEKTSGSQYFRARASLAKRIRMYAETHQ